MNHFSNKKFNLIKFGKSAITIGSLTLPVLISTTTNSMIRNPRTASMFIKLGGGTSSSSVKTANTLKTTTTSSTSTGNTTTPKSNLSGKSYREMAIINTGKSSSTIAYRIASLQSSNISTTSSTSTPLPIPKGTVTNMKEMFNNTFRATLSSGFSTESSPTGNVALLAKNFTSSSTSTPSHTNSGKTSAPSGTGNVARLSQRFASSSTSTTSSSSSGGASSSTGNVARIRKMFGN